MLNEVLIAPVERYAARLDGTGAAMIIACVQPRMGRLAEEKYARLVRVLQPVAAAEQIAGLEKRRAALRTRARQE